MAAISGVSTIVGEYLGNDEDDCVSKQALVEHQIFGARLPRSFLDWTQRLPDIQSKIKDSFDFVQKDNCQSYKFKGEVRYGLCKIDESALVKAIIQQASRGQKDFYIVDMGAGNFALGDYLAQYLNGENGLPPDINIHIISVTAEEYTGDKLTTIGRCKHYRFGNFKAEDLLVELEKRGFGLEGCVDFIVSRWCFPHFVDSVGTFGQSYNLLRPGTGIYLGHGFYFFYQNQTQTDWCSLGNLLMRKENMLRLLADTRAPVLVEMTEGWLDEFLLRRLDESPCELEMSYEALEKRKNSGLTVATDSVCKFRREPQSYESRFSLNIPETISGALYGSKSLFNWLQAHRIIPNHRKWEPLLLPRVSI